MNEAFAAAVRKSRDEYIDNLTDVAWKSLQEVGLTVGPHAGRVWSELRYVISSQVTVPRD